MTRIREEDCWFAYFSTALKFLTALIFLIAINSLMH